MAIIVNIIKKPVTVLVLVILITLFGIFSALQLSLDFSPEVEAPNLIVVTSYPDASPEDVEENVTKVMEKSLRGIENLLTISSESNAGQSRIDLEFKYGSNLETHTNNIRERLDRIRNSFPKEVDFPVIYKYNSTDRPIMEVAMVSNRSINDTREYYDNQLSNYFDQINGVARVEVAGGQKKRVYVEPSINRLNAFHLTLEDINNAISTNGRRSSVGVISTEISDIGLVIDNNYNSLDQISDLVIEERLSEYNEPYFIRLRDVADVRFGYDVASNLSLLNDRPSLIIEFYKLANTNIVEVAENIKTQIKKLQNTLPNDFEILTTFDDSIFIKDELSAVWKAIFSGGVLVVLVLLLFLRNITSVLVIMISMPISIILTLMFMYFAGLTINFMTLAGLVLGIGMLVDNSIVLLEHIYHKRLKGLNLIAASGHGASEMARPIMASTLTTVLVFIPILIFKNELGYIAGYFVPLIFTVVVSVLASYCVAAFFLPVLTSKFIPLKVPHPNGIFKTLDDFFKFLLTKIESLYYQFLGYTLKRRKRFMALILVLALLPLLLVPKIEFVFIPNIAPDFVRTKFTFPANYSIKDMHDIIKDFQSRTSYLSDEIGIKFTTINIIGRVTSFNLYSTSANTGVIFVYFLNTVNLKKHKELVKAMIPYSKIYPGVTLATSGYSNSGGGGGGKKFNLEVKSQDYDQLLSTVSEITRLFQENLPQLSNIANNQEESQLEYNVDIDRTQANSYGLSITRIIDEVQTALRGKNAGMFIENALEYDIRLRLAAHDRARTDVAERLYINTSSGNRVPLGNVINRSYDTALKKIYRKNFQRSISISADLVGNYTSSQAVTDTKNLLANYLLPENVSIEYAGEFQDIKKTFPILIWIFILSILFVYGIMASQFESFLDPFIIIFTVPLTLAGVIVLYFFTGSQISAFTIVGLIMLVGMVVNHGIVMVDYMNTLQKRGEPLEKAILVGAQSRLYPILMTSCTTIFGLLPIMVSNFSGAEFIQPLALTVAGGLTASALFSLYFIPLLYLGLNRRKQARNARHLQRHPN